MLTRAVCRRVRSECEQAVRQGPQQKPYRDFMRRLGLRQQNPQHRRLLALALQANAQEDFEHGRPLSAVAAVRATTGLPGAGFFQQARELGLPVGADEAAFARDHWARYIAFVLNGRSAGNGRRKAA